jgi:Ca2+-binding RTX toxin-like protein
MATLSGTNGADRVQLGDRDLYNTYYALGGNDTVSGSTSSDRIWGNGGNDRLAGNDNWDTLFGGRGNDELFGGQGLDTLYGDGGNDRLFGNGDGDTLIGGVGSDLLSGGAGDDFLMGSFSYEGNPVTEIDTLTGGSGRDTFALSATTVGGNYRSYFRLGFRDMAIITDYNRAEDQIFLPGEKSHYVISAYRGGTLISLDLNQNGRFGVGDDPIAQINGTSFNLNQAIYLMG